MQGEELAKNAGSEVGYTGAHQVMVGPETREIDLVDRDGNGIARLYVLGGDHPDTGLVIGISLHQKDRTLVAAVHGPLEQMTSEHVRATGRSVAEFPEATFAEVKIGDARSQRVAAWEEKHVAR